MFGELADQACIDHIRLDRLEKERLKKEKIGYWKNHQLVKPSMIKNVTHYCGTKFLEELIQKCDITPYVNDQYYLRKRDKALISTLFLTGGRISEILMLKKENFDFDNEEANRNNAFIVRDMGLLKHRIGTGKPRRVTRTFPIWNDDPLVQYLVEWLGEVKEYLFHLKGYTKDYMKRGRAWQIISNLGKSMDIPIHINPSWFRIQREYQLVKERGFSPYDVQAYFKLRHPPKIFRQREDWQNLLAVSRPVK